MHFNNVSAWCIALYQKNGEDRYPSLCCPKVFSILINETS